MAQAALATMYNDGLGLRQNYVEAAKWMRKAADQGMAEAQIEMGKAYLEGKGVRQNYTISKEYFGKACDSGDNRGCQEYAKLNKAGY